MSTLRGRYVDLYPNPQREEIIGLMKESSVYLSTQPDEVFGMAVLEAMIAGCVSVVYLNGGHGTTYSEHRTEKLDTATRRAGRPPSV